VDDWRLRRDLARIVLGGLALALVAIPLGFLYAEVLYEHKTVIVTGVAYRDNQLTVIQTAPSAAIVQEAGLLDDLAHDWRIERVDRLDDAGAGSGRGIYRLSRPRWLLFWLAPAGTLALLVAAYWLWASRA
jgi:hypothetical protein